MRNHLKSIARAVFGAFLPASVTAWGSVLAMVVISDPRSVRWSTLRIAAIEWGLMAAGYAVAQLWLPRTRFGRVLSQRSHALAGIGSPILLVGLSVLVQGVTTAGVAVLSFTTGLTVGVIQWMRSRRKVPPTPPTLEALERDADDALARALGEGTRSADVIPIRKRDGVPSDETVLRRQRNRKAGRLAV